MVLSNERVKVYRAAISSKLLNRSALVFARLGYAGMAGGGLVLGTVLAPDRAIVGEYVYGIGAASVIATIAVLGIDRVLARRISSGEMPVCVPRSVMRFRISESALLLISIISISVFCFDVNFPLALAMGTFVVSRTLYVDIESIWIAASASPYRLSAALCVNGFLSATGLIIGVFHSAAAMVFFSAAGNVIAILILWFSTVLRVRDEPLIEMVSESRGIAGSLILSAVYSRVDLLLLAALGSSLSAVAVYGLIVRVFDTLSVVRGALAQQQTRDISSMSRPLKSESLCDWSLRLQVRMAIVSAFALGLASIWYGFGGVDAQDSFAIVCVFVIGIPLFFAHLPTSAMIFSDRRTGLLLFGSVVCCALSVAIKYILISSFGVVGAVAALSVMEWVSCAVFYTLYWRGMFSSRSAIIVAAPFLASLALLVVFSLLVWML